jgi:hypothetical protein
MSGVRLKLYRVGDPGWSVGRNIYDYRPDGGKRYIIGVYAVLGARCLSFVWRRPGRDVGTRRSPTRPVREAATDE